MATPMFSPSSTRPSVYPGGTNNYLLAMLRDNFQISTWMLMGAALVGTSFFLVGSWAFYGVIAVYTWLAGQLLYSVVMALGWIPNVWLKDVIPEKFTAQLPPQDPEDNGPSSSGLCVFLLGSRFNHPLGLLAPGVKEISDWAEKCYVECRDNEEYGLLGMSHFLGTERSANNTIATLMYFRTTAGLHKFALSQVHRDTWSWWLEIQKKYPHLAIMHETYDVLPKHWESVYVHMHKAGLSGASVKLDDKDSEGKALWWSTPVQANRGKFRSSKGRLGWSEGDDNEKVGFMEYH
ncbi:hypothetical protein DACRYDRAFT_21415 [Dacryopinax primogenitus]|uniref:Uncharacterized protein n=1 Tax=Dacryopinax primogenitus (strain DJM 731) TaxID=1858805 RepID=M5GE92_DACPD|nr:uncharacterized protein DACRYDRAFT_21415 [Dacryopinax primogenitus]EJU03093.1 hypothetical protein DACRYDRAFT_21415 [Dacryopinax primogenitus]